MNRTAWPAVASLLTILACGRSASREGVREALMAADRAFDSVVAVRGVEGWVSFYTDSGMEIPESGEPVVGRDAIRKHMSGLLSDTTLKLRWAPDKAEASADGSLGFTTGHWRLLAHDSTGEHAAYRGKFLTVWRRQPDGSWKVEADIGNTEPAGP